MNEANNLYTNTEARKIALEDSAKNDAMTLLTMVVNGNYTPGIDDYVLRCKISAIVDSYNELIMAVERKWPNETRHETALRYIKQMEEPSDTMAKEKSNDNSIR